MFITIRFFSMLLGAFVGGLVGFRVDGVPSAFGGVLAGAFVGEFLGRLPYALALFLLQRGAGRDSVAALEARLEKEYYVSHHLLAQLAARGEPMERHEGYVLSLLRSEDMDKRRFGWTNLNLWFPALAAKLGDFNPEASTEECRGRLEVLSPPPPGPPTTE
ncbi:hypothetical protein ACLESD_07625 [Pyxidicoccus sp. 3LFB2]